MVRCGFKERFSGLVTSEKRIWDVLGSKPGCSTGYHDGDSCFFSHEEPLNKSLKQVKATLFLTF